MLNKSALLVINPADLPSLPAAIRKLQDIVSEDAPDIQEIAGIIETDQAFTAKLLKLVNSPFYGYSRKIVSVEEALAILGFNTLRSLLMATSLIGSIRTDSRILDAGRFWRHSFGVGVIAKHLLFKAGKEAREEALVGGILHDIGRLVMAKMDPKLFVWFYFERAVVTSLEEETEYFGFDHQMIGETLAVKWKFPAGIVEAIARHHTPTSAVVSPQLVAAVNIADMLCHALNIGESGNHYISSFHPEAWAVLGLNMGELETALHESVNEIKRSEGIFTQVSQAN
jgi:putative nucleotidyltransferase with HDIG domain